MDELSEQTAWKLWLPKNEHEENREARPEVRLGLLRLLKHTFKDHWSPPHTGSHECPSSSTNGHAPNSPAACGFCSEQLKNFQQTYRRQDERRLPFYTSGPESPPLPFAPQALSPRDMCNFPFILTVWCIFSPKASGAWEPCTKWRSSDPAVEDFWGVPVPAPTEVWLLTIPEFPRNFRT